MKNSIRNALRITYYGDRGDPDPPNEYRPELILNGQRYVNIEDFLSGNNGCMPKAKAKAKLQKLKLALKEFAANNFEEMER
jgi:hypothetical protein